MTGKAYIVANKKQELDVLKKFEDEVLAFIYGNNPTEQATSKASFFNTFIGFPYALIERKGISWSLVSEITDATIVYDGRKEYAEVDTKYKVTPEFMNGLIGWRDDQRLGMNTELIRSFLDISHVQKFPDVIDIWWTYPENTVENNNRLIAIIQWLNGEDVFEVEDPHKFIVRSDKNDNDGDYTYILVENGMTTTAYILDTATKFNTREEAQEWANSHQVVVEIDEDGNEVEQ